MTLVLARGMCGWGPARRRRVGEWDMELWLPAFSRGSIYDPELTEAVGVDEDSESPSLAIAAGADRVEAAWVLVPRDGGFYCWNYQSWEVLHELRPGDYITWFAKKTWVVSANDAANAGLRAVWYYCSRYGESVWNLPPPKPKDAALPDIVKPWVAPGSAVVLANMPHDLRRFEGKIVTVARVSTRLAVVDLPPFFGPDSLEVRLSWVYPLQPNTIVHLKKTRKSRKRGEAASGYVTIFEFRDELAKPYRVQLPSGELRWVRSTELSPSVPIQGFELSQKVTALDWATTSEQRCTFVDSAGRQHAFMVHLPLAFNEWKKQQGEGGRLDAWPLLVYLHGSGNTGNETSFFHSSRAALESPGVKFAAERFVTIAPACEWKWQDKPLPWVLELVELFRACTWIDHERVYLTGNSMGGMGTWHLAAQRPDLFAAVAPIAGYGCEDIREAVASALKGTPILVAVSSIDTTCKMHQEIPLYDKLLEAGCRKLQVFVSHTVDHCSLTDKVYNEWDFLYRWLLAHRKA